MTEGYTIKRNICARRHSITIRDLSPKAAQRIMLEGKEIPIKQSKRFGIDEEKFLDFRGNICEKSIFEYIHIVDRTAANSNCACSHGVSEEEMVGKNYYDLRTKCDALTCPQAEKGDFCLSKQEEQEKVKEFLKQETDWLNDKISHTKSKQEELKNKSDSLSKKLDFVSDALLTYDTLVGYKKRTEKD